MALESALVLEEELRAPVTRHGGVRAARRRNATAAASRMMFPNNCVLVGSRGLALRVVRPQDLVGNIVRMAEQPI